MCRANPCNTTFPYCIEHNSSYCCILDTHHLHNAFLFIYFFFLSLSNVNICHYDQDTLTVTLWGDTMFHSPPAFGIYYCNTEKVLIAWTPIFPTLHTGPVSDTGIHPSSANYWRKDVCHLFLRAHVPTSSPWLALLLWVVFVICFWFRPSGQGVSIILVCVQAYTWLLNQRTSFSDLLARSFRIPDSKAPFTGSSDNKFTPVRLFG